MIRSSRLCSVLATVSLLAACNTAPERRSPTTEALKDALQANATTQLAPPPDVQQALLPPLEATLPHTESPPAPSFDVSVNGVPARQFFMSLVDGTGDNMVIHPEVSGTLTLDLKNVTVDDVLATVRDVYGYEYRYSHGVYQVFPARMRSQVFKVDYLDIKRKGGSRMRVSSGQVTQAPVTSPTTPGLASGQRPPSSIYGGATSGAQNLNNNFSGTQVTTRSESDFWVDLKATLKTMIGEQDGRKVVANPLSGTVLVRAMPRELLDVENFLKTLEQSVSRQVIIEAKILEVRLDDAFQAGVNWNALIQLAGSKEILLGQAGGGTVFDSGFAESAGRSIALDSASLKGTTATAFGGVFALKAHLGDFNTLIELLKSQGDVQVLSSPRVSTMNNQKAIIKVGTDSYFVTDVDIDTDTSTTVLNQSADITLTPFFSGVALDVTPQIDDSHSVTLHVHPAISEVTEQSKDISISSQTELKLPLATSTIRESDTIIRAGNGQVVVIGGLMQNSTRDQQASTPFLGELPILGHLFRHTRRVASKTELVILLRPVVVDRNQVWSDELRAAVRRFEGADQPGRP